MNIHFVGIGGIGMSALAEISLAKGNNVSGSDLCLNNLTEELNIKGGKIYAGHDKGNLEDNIDLVVRSSCIRDSNPEIIKAEELGIPVIFRGEMLNRTLSDFPCSLGITGTHGKTTTSSLAAHIAEYCKKDPTAILGGEIACFDSGNAKLGNGKIAVAEVDESDGYFKNIRTTCGLITNIEREHMENYGSWEDLMDSYAGFIEKISEDGVFIYNGEDKNIISLLENSRAAAVSFGMEGDFDVSCSNVSFAKGIHFDLLINGRYKGTVDSSLIGRYNVMNILGAIALSVEAGIAVEDVIKGIGTFNGTKRRFERVAKIGNIEIVEDYAHHPTELKAVLSAAKQYAGGRVIAVFQPHRYSRTKDLLKDFTECFYAADVLVLTDIYSANEDIIDGTAGANIFKSIDKKRFDDVVFKKKEDVSEYISGKVGENDLILILGAGDIREIVDVLVKLVEKQNG